MSCEYRPIHRKHLKLIHASNSRGRKIYRRFTPDPDHPNLSSEETEIECSTSPRRRPMTRASVKPRLLFPTEKQRHERELADEEALTDIEDKTQENLVTPIKQSFTNASATPPTTGHATRSATRKAAVNGRSSPLVGLMEAAVEESMTATKRRPRKKTSPFDGWQRTKAGKGRKRGAEQIDQDGEDVRGKKVKGNASP